MSSPVPKSPIFTYWQFFTTWAFVKIHPLFVTAKPLPVEVGGCAQTELKTVNEKTVRHEKKENE